KWIGNGKLVETTWPRAEEIGPDSRALFPEANAFLEHERLSFISFPYEWSCSMVADAALLTLDLQIALTERGYALKDASAYNVQFRSGKPVFIDVSSIEKAERVDLWAALGQFQRMFLFPLLLLVKRGIDLRSCYLAHLDGWPIEQVSRVFPGLSRW